MFLASKGLLLSTKKPYVAASLDNIRSCSCGDDCPDVVVEYKCPWKHQNSTPKKAFVTPEICGEKVKDKFLLKTSSQYYCQIQLQMFVAELDACDFVVWTKEGILSVSVQYNKNFMLSVVSFLWFNYVFPCFVQKVSQDHSNEGKIFLFLYINNYEF